WVGRILTLYALLPFLGTFAVLEGLQHMIGPLAHWLFGVHPEIWTPTAQLIGSGFLFAVMHFRPVRAGVWWLVLRIGRALRFVLWTVPIRVWMHPIVRDFLASRLNRWVLRPALFGAFAIVFPWPNELVRWIVAAGVALGVAFGLNSRIGRKIEEKVTDWLVLS